MPGFDFDNLFENFRGFKTAVIGDVMLDTYWWGHVERISPEAPVPVVALDKKEQRIGGAGNVALNLASLGARVEMLSVMGKDQDGESLTDLFNRNNIGTKNLLYSDSRITTNKSRIISRNQQMMRLDAEITKELDKTDQEQFLSRIKHYLQEEKPEVLIFEDYNKGVLTEAVIREVISICREQKIITAVDPKRKNFFAFQGVNIFKPNLKEVKEGLNMLVEKVDASTLNKIHHQLKDQLHHQISFITLSEKGVYYNNSESSRLIDSHLRNIADVSGAGDTVIAVAALTYASTKSVDLMASIANIAGGLVCEQVGTVAIDKASLLSECKLLLNWERRMES